MTSAWPSRARPPSSGWRSRRPSRARRAPAGPHGGPLMTRPVRIANCSGFYGDRLAAAREMLTGPVDVLTGDYLAELTMLILWKARQKDPGQIGRASCRERVEITVQPS